MKFSVITVCKNEENSIENTIKSILNQSYNDFEYIVIDGNSTDNTLNIINKYRNNAKKNGEMTKNIDMVISEPDGGVYSAMNKGIVRAKGDYLCFINGNDTFSDDFVLEKISQDIFFAKEAMLIIGQVNFYENGEYYYTSSQEAIKTLYDFQRSFYSHQGIFYKKEVFEKYGLYDENIKILSDNFKNAEVLINNEPILYTNNVVANFTMGGLSTNPATRAQLTEEKILLRKKMFGQKVKLFKILQTLRIFTPTLYKFYLNSFLSNWEILNII